MNLSEVGAQTLAQREGTRLKPYNDSKGYCTTGIGHLVAYHRCTPADIAQWTLSSKEAAVELFRKDLAASYEPAVNDFVKVPLTQNQYDALVSFVYNVGVNGFKNSTLLKRLNAGDYEGAATAFMMWNKPSKIIGRRRGEMNQFRTPYGNQQPVSQRIAPNLLLRGPSTKFAKAEWLHPVFRMRLEQTYDQVPFTNKSGGRSRQRQAELYSLFKRGKGNPANPPGTSWHEYDEDGSTLAQAADIHPKPGFTYAQLQAAGKRHGLHFPVKSEDWHCVDTDTEILTSTGWKDYNSVRTGDLALTLNPDTRLSEWQSISAVIRLPSSERQMLAMEGQDHSSLTTADHRWFVERTTYEKRRRAGRVPAFTTSRLGFNANDRIPLVAPLNSFPEFPKYSDAIVELLAWYWTEGSDFNANQVAIYQSLSVNPDKVLRIRSALTKAFGPSVMTLRPRGYLSEPAWKEVTIPRRRGRALDVEEDVHFALNQHAGRILRELMPDRTPTVSFLGTLTEAQLRLFLDVSILGDGHQSGTRRFLSQARKEPLDALQAACSWLGIATHLRKRPGVWILSLRTRTTLMPHEAIRSSQFKQSWVMHTGPVWCVTTPNSTWFARRRGTTYFTGNCQPIEARNSSRVEGQGLGPVPAYWNPEPLEEDEEMGKPYIFGVKSDDPSLDGIWEMGTDEVARHIPTFDDVEALKKAGRIDVGAMTPAWLERHLRITPPLGNLPEVPKVKK